MSEWCPTCYELEMRCRYDRAVNGESGRNKAITEAEV